MLNVEYVDQTIKRKKKEIYSLYIIHVCLNLKFEKFKKICGNWSHYLFYDPNPLHNHSILHLREGL